MNADKKQIAILTRRIELDAANFKILWDGAQEEIASLKKEKEDYANEVFLSVVGHQEAEIADLQKEVEDLRCCGNCIHCIDEFGLECPHRKKVVNAKDCCSCWQSDQLTRKERENEYSKT